MVDIKFLKYLAKKGNYLFEVAITQHAVLSKFNKDSVNTFRVITQFIPSQGAKILFCTLRMGRKGSIMDNASRGGLFAGVNIENGDLYPLAYDIDNNSYSVHPDTGIVFKGQKFLMIREIFRLCIKAANLFPTLSSIGWDVTYTEKGPVVIEANNRWGLSLFQFPNGGIADVLEKEWGHLI